MTTDNNDDSNYRKYWGKADRPVTGDHDDPTNFNFDFEAYFERAGNRELSEEESSEFEMRLMGQFCRDFWKGGGAGVPDWIMDHIATKFFQVLIGDNLNNAFPLPWDPADREFSRTEEQSLGIFCDVANQLKSDEKAKVTNVIASVAQDYNVSYETARAAYYKHAKLTHNLFLKKS